MADTDTLGPDKNYSFVDNRYLYPKAYGNMYLYTLGSGPIVVSVGTTDTYYQIGSLLSGGLTNNFTFQNGRELLSSVPGTYIVNWTIVPEVASANQEIEGAVMINGTVNTTVAAHGYQTDSSKPICIASNGIISLGKADVVSLAVLNHSAVHNITIDHANLSLARIG